MLFKNKGIGAILGLNPIYTFSRHGRDHLVIMQTKTCNK